MPIPPPIDAPQDERSLERYLIVGLVLMIGLVVAFPFYRATEPARRARASEALEAERVALGREAYALHCAACHGEAARGGRGMPTLAAREFLGNVSDRQLSWLIAGGIPGTTMSAYDIDLGGPFTAQETDRVVAYLRSLEVDAPSVPGWRAGAAAPVAAVLSAESLAAKAPSTEAPIAEPGVADAARATEMAGAEASPAAEAAGAEASTGAEAAVAEASTGAETAVVGLDPGAPSPRPAPPSAAAPDGEDPGPPAEVVAATGPTEAEVATLYRNLCAACHGAAGEGSPIAPAVRPPRPPLDEDFEALVAAIARGRSGTAMMGFSSAVGGPLDDAKVRALARWLAVGAAADEPPRP
jgi:mono/diheme cytochrome c family protein